MTDAPHKKFTRTVEDFVCAHCGSEVRGDGFTNHCPHCLWSKHVDENPGDRRCLCTGLMEPIGIEIERGVHNIMHKCVQCGVQKRNQAHERDSFEKLLEIARAQNEK